MRLLIWHIIWISNCDIIYDMRSDLIILDSVILSTTGNLKINILMFFIDHCRIL